MFDAHLSNINVAVGKNKRGTLNVTVHIILFIQNAILFKLRLESERHEAVYFIEQKDGNLVKQLRAVVIVERSQLTGQEFKEFQTLFFIIREGQNQPQNELYQRNLIPSLQG